MFGGRAATLQVTHYLRAAGTRCTAGARSS